MTRHAVAVALVLATIAIAPSGPQPVLPPVADERARPAADVDGPGVPLQAPALDPATFMATFVPSGRSDTPVDLAVHSNRPVVAMHLQVGYGKWIPMERGLSGEFTTQLDGGPWEFWTAQTTPPMGSLVVFRATGADGAQAFSYAYSWAPNGD